MGMEKGEFVQVLDCGHFGSSQIFGNKIRKIFPCRAIQKKLNLGVIQRIEAFIWREWPFSFHNFVLNIV